MTEEISLPDGPLTGLRVVEFGQLIAGPYVGTLLADFGADVIKVEAPPNGDALREWGQHKHNGHSLWWSVMARGKRSVALTSAPTTASAAPSSCARRPTSSSRTSGPARWRSGGWAPRTSTP